MRKNAPLTKLKKLNKKLRSYRLSEITREQLKRMSAYDGITETDLIVLAIEELYIKNYHRKMPKQFPNLRKTDYLVM
ncbi:MAG: hypothetical protein FWC97_02305 [Treponema sp.]|nr:hypothetical protein [Treponema sp.]